MATDARIQQAFKEELKDVTTIIIAQRISSIQHTDWIIVMNEGRIESMGKHEGITGDLLRSAGKSMRHNRGECGRVRGPGRGNMKLRPDNPGKTLLRVIQLLQV